MVLHVHATTTWQFYEIVQQPPWLLLLFLTAVTSCIWCIAVPGLTSSTKAIVCFFFLSMTLPRESHRTTPFGSASFGLRQFFEGLLIGSSLLITMPSGNEDLQAVRALSSKICRGPATELGTVFCGDHDGVQNLFGQPQFEYELAKRAHAYLSAENTQDFGTTLHAVSSVLEELRKTNAAATASCK